MFRVRANSIAASVAASGLDLAAEQHHGLLGAGQQVGERLGRGRVACALGRGAVSPGLRDGGLLDGYATVEDVARDLEERGPRCAVVALSERHRDHVGGACGVRHRRGELRDGGHHVDVRQVLQGAHLVLAQRALTADQQHRALRAERVRDTGHGVGRARSRGDHRATRAAGDSGVPVSGVSCDLFVANVDDVDALVDATVVDVDDVAATQREDHVDALRLEGFGDQVPPRDGRGVLLGFRHARLDVGLGHCLCHLCCQLLIGRSVGQAPQVVVGCIPYVVAPVLSHFRALSQHLRFSM